MGIEFKDARRENVWLRKLLIGATGAGKTKGALEVASNLFGGELQIVGVDSEHGRMKLYADAYRFKHHEMVDDFSPEAYIAAIDAAESAFPGGILLLDSISHEWMGKGGVLQLADRFGQWKDVRPRHTAFVERILETQMHVIACCRAKMKYDVTEEERDGGRGTRQVINKLGLGPIQDDQIAYEFDVVAHMDVASHLATFSNRCDPLVDTVRSLIPGTEVAEILTDWLSSGEPPAPVEAASDDAVQELVELLAAEGRPQAIIDEKFAVARRENRGKLHPEYVTKNIEAAKKRLAAKGQPEGRSAPSIESEAEVREGADRVERAKQGESAATSEQAGTDESTVDGERAGHEEGAVGDERAAAKPSGGRGKKADEQEALV